MHIHKAIFVVLLCQLNTLHFASCFHQPDVASFGDFMEFFLIVPVSCSNITNGQNTTNFIVKNFADCTTNITSTTTVAFGNLELICENQVKYLQCWDQLKNDLVTKCQQNGPVPVVYEATVKSLCGSDKGNTTISNIKRAAEKVTEDDRDNCPEETGIHWLDNCKSTLEAMASKNSCERHNAIDNCMGKIICQNFEVGRLFKQVYTGGRAYLNCNSQH